MRIRRIKALLLDKEASEMALKVQEAHSEKDALVGEIERIS